MKHLPYEVYVGLHGIREVYLRAIDPAVPDGKVVRSRKNGAFDAVLMVMVAGAIVELFLAWLLGVEL